MAEREESALWMTEGSQKAHTSREIHDVRACLGRELGMGAKTAAPLQRSMRVAAETE